MPNFPVTRLSQRLVTPSEATPAEALPLSALDRQVHRHHIFIRTLLVFRHRGDAPAPAPTAASSICDALSKALVHYYPLAGRFLRDDDGEVKKKNVLVVDCNGKGAWFTEAVGHCELEDVDYLDHPCAIPMSDLLPQQEEDHPLLLLQVTQFTCGGLVIGIDASHAMVDGIGCAQFINAIADLARGNEQPTIKPIWLRETYPSSILVPLALPSSLLDSSLLHHEATNISMDYINRVKDDYMEKMGKRCTNFEVSVASLWQCRTRAIESNAGIDVKLIFVINTRPQLSDVLPPEGGYYGNSVAPMVISAPSRFISSSSILEVVKLISDAKVKFPYFFAQLRSGEFNVEHLQELSDYNTLVVSDWARLGFNDINYGWGTLTRINVDSFVCVGFPFCVLGLPSSCKNSLRMISRCVMEKHSAAFQHETMKLN